MGDLKTINAREANQRFSELLSRVEKDGCGFLVTKRGRPVARLLPVGPRTG
jgi:prevent-host-death family protein